jgi:predicted amidohydrolase
MKPHLTAALAIFTIVVSSPWTYAQESTAERSPPPSTVTVAAIQCPSVLGDVAGNRAKLKSLIERAAGHGAKIVVLPEAAITGYLSQNLKTDWHIEGRPLYKAFTAKDPASFAEPVPGPSTDEFAALAGRLGIYLTIPLVEVDKPTGADLFQPTRYFNTVCLASPDGKLVAHYRKLTPWPYPEDAWATPGDRGIQVYDTEYGRVGLAICFDIHSILEKYEPQNIWALLYPIAWVDDSHPADWFWHRLPKRLAPFNFYVVGANWSVDDPQPWFGYGFSTIYAPGGKIIATSHSLYGPDIVYADIPIASALAAKPATER